MTRLLRRDPLTGEEVVLSTERAVGRLPRFGPRVDPSVCPFCPGHEEHTRPTIEAVHCDGAWSARAFANRRPALVVEEVLRGATDGVFQQVSGVGAHEVLVESSEHRPLHHQPVGRIEDAMGLAVRRLRDLRGDRRLRTLAWFRNHGEASGATQEHPHAQVVGLPLIPHRWARLAERSRAHLEATGTPLLRAVLEGEERDGRRIVGRWGPITAFCPFAPRHPFEVWLVARDPGPGLADATDAEISGLAAATAHVLRALERAVGPEVPYTAAALGAAEGVDPKGIGWHIRIEPRLLVAGGLELGTGVGMHGVLPEDAARALRVAV